MKAQYKFALGMAGGLLAGSALGLMLAPRRGKESRKAIVSQAEKLGRKVKELKKDGSARDSFSQGVGASG